MAGATNFFAQQHQARRNTKLMVFLFLLAVAAIVLAVNLVLVILWMAVVEDTPLGSGAGALLGVPGPVLWGGTIVALGTIAGGTLFRIAQLSKGGAAVAAMVGAQHVKRDAQDQSERRLMNIVEEMAIASGITVPAVFVMQDQDGINAFAAGYSPNEAAVTVTRGALERLSRDELQGVIAHEFSHIFNGDMRLNVRLLGVIAGIVLIGGIGRFLMDAGRGGRGRRGDGRIFLAGLALWLIGGVGVFFGRLIKAAVSREREYLADAASVQFTRNPEGIGGALYKIGQTSGAISNRYAEEFSHMYFSEAVGGMFARLFATHPPIEDRITRVLGDRGLLLLRSQAKKDVADGPDDVAAEGAAASPADAGLLAAAPMAGATGVEWGRRAGDQTVRAAPAGVIASIGRPTMQHIDYARQVLRELPESVRQAISTVEGAQAAVLALLVAAEGETRDRQAVMIRDAAGVAVSGRTLVLADALRSVGPGSRLPVLDLAIPTLRELPQTNRDRLVALVKDLIDADRRVTISEFVLITLCRRHLGRDAKGAPPVKHKSLRPVSKEVATVVSMLVHAGRSRPEAFERAMALLELNGHALRPSAELNFSAIEAALYELKLLAPLAKPAMIKAFLAVIIDDNTVTIAEAELMRAICAALDTPLPPILESLSEE